MMLPYFKRVSSNIEQMQIMIQKQEKELHQYRAGNNGKMQTKLINNFEQYDEFIDNYRTDNMRMEELDYLRHHQLNVHAFYRNFGSYPPNYDPFSDEYRTWEISFFEFLSGKPYCHTSEGFDVTRKIDGSELKFDINVNQTFTHEQRINRMREHIDLMDIMKPGYGVRILELGSGWGHLAEFLARFGCHLTCVDASKDFIKYADNRLKTQGFDAKFICGSFFDIDNFNETYDIVVFEHSFHHCNDPVRLMNLLYEKTNPKCKIYFVGEEIVEHFDRPWGVVRYDGETLLQIRLRGWSEFGFRNDFFEELIKRAGFKLITNTRGHNNLQIIVIERQ